MARDAFILEAVRTPIGKRGGALKDVRPDALAPGASGNRQCGSGQQAVNFAAQGIMSGMHDLLIGGGVESMTRVPMGSDAGVLNDRLLAKYEIVPQGVSADYVAKKYDVTRAQVDEYSYHSHMRAMRAIDEGRFRREIVPVPVKDERGEKRLFDTDEHPRRNTSIEKCPP